MKKLIISLFTASSCFLNGASGAVAMGDLGANINNFWSVLISSYWWDNRDDYLRVFALSDVAAHRVALLADELEPVGLVKTAASQEPPRESGAECRDFGVVKLSDVDVSDAAHFPFRVHHPKSAIYAKYEGWLSGVGMPSRTIVWIAAMLPNGAVQLFNDNKVGLNPTVLARPFLSEMGYENGLQAMPANEVRLRDVMQCDGFSIYVVEYGT